MASVIKRFSDGSVLEFDKGGFDNFCIFLTRPQTARHAPKDTQYFTSFQQFAKKYTGKRLYDDFVTIYNRTSANLNSQTVELIEAISRGYIDDALELDILFTTVYAGMIAEENKADTKLGKRVKRLGMYQILMEQTGPIFAANFSRGKPWRQIDQECRKRGF